MAKDYLLTEIGRAVRNIDNAVGITPSASEVAGRSHLAHTGQDLKRKTVFFKVQFLAQAAKPLDIHCQVRTAVDGM